MKLSTRRIGFGPPTPMWPVVALGIALGIGACNDTEESTGPEDGVAALVVVSPERVTHPFSLDTVRLTAEAFDALGEPLADAPFIWTSSDTTVAAVDPTGLVATRRYGRVQIKARTGDAIGRGEVIVSPGTPLENECMRCHTASNAYRHVAWGFPAASCTVCHVMDASPHSDKVNAHDAAASGFALSGAHAAATCTVCHEPGSGTVAASPENDQDCVACHLADYEGFHPSGWPTVCAACHNTTTWSGATIDHELASGGFRLLGAHAALDCSSCHQPDTFVPLWDPADDSDCVTCHQPLYDVQHGGSGYPTTCLTCHTTTSWSGATFDHQAASGFALPTDHADFICTACHDPVTFAPLYAPSSNTDCIACHQSDYAGEHPAGWPTDCTQCHTTAGWSSATVDHTTVSGGFTLVGTHTDLVCVSCHEAGTFTPLFNPQSTDDCIACHQGLYDVQHAADGYPTACLTCHTTTGWVPASFDHDANWFPIFSGRHERRWATCATCHANAVDFTEFTCFNCHTHNQTAMDNKHSGVAGYAYDSATCYGCHPRGEAP